MDEIWKDIPGYEGLYQISSFGRVKALSKKWLSHHTAMFKRAETIVKGEINSNGYVRVTLYKNRKPKKYPVHRLVANAFIPNIENKNEINHKDFNRVNNCVDNLEWCSRKENALYSRENSRTSALNIKKPKTGHHYIYPHKSKYRIEIKIDNFRFTKVCESLDEAISIRDKKLMEIK